MAVAVKKKNYTAKDIIALVEKKEQSAEFSELLAQMEADFNLFSLDPYQPEPEHEGYTSPAPRNDFLKVFHGVNKASLTWQIAIPEDAPENEQKAAGRGELLLTGIIDRANRSQRNIGEPSLRESLAWFACTRGVVGLRCLIYSNEEKETEIDIRPIDPMHMVWEGGAKGLQWVAIKYIISKTEAEERFGITFTGDEDIDFIDFFDRNINAWVLTTGGGLNQFAKEPTEHGLDHVPVFIGFNGGMPTVRSKDNVLALKQRAASVWASARQFYDKRNKQVSFVMDVAEKSVAGTLIYKTRTGKKGIKVDPFGSWQVLELEIGEELAPLMPPEVPTASTIVLSVLDRDKAESTVPFPIGYGVDPQAHSGAALAMMNDNTRSIYSPFTGSLENGFLWLCEEILGQFKTNGQKLSVKGFDTGGKFFVLEVTPEDIKDGWYINVKCEPRLPRDEAGEMQMAMVATQPGQDGVPLMSRFTAREKILKLQDPTAEKKRIADERIEQMILSMPNIQVRRVADELRAKGDLKGAEELLASLPSPMGGGGQGGGQQPPPGGQGMGGQGMPPGAPQGTPQGIPSGMPMPTPQELQQLVSVAEQLRAQGKPIPPELLAVIQAAMQAQGGGQPPVI